MGKSSKPLIIAAPAWLIGTPEFKKLAERGYHFVPMDQQIDFYIGDHCWFFTKDHYRAGLLTKALTWGGNIRDDSTSA